MDFYIRKFELGDLGGGFIESLASLDPTIYSTSLDALHDAKRERARLEYMHTFVAEDKATRRIVGTATVVFEPKFIHATGLVAHIEDVSVAKSAQGCGVGKTLVDYCVEFARLCDCYKVILSCSQNNTAFYEKCGFKQHEIEMRIDMKE